MLKNRTVPWSLSLVLLAGCVELPAVPVPSSGRDTGAPADATDLDATDLDTATADDGGPDDVGPADTGGTRTSPIPSATTSRTRQTRTTFGWPTGCGCPPARS